MLRGCGAIKSIAMIARIRVEPGKRAKIAERDAEDTLGLGGKAEANAQLEELQRRLEHLQGRLSAECRRSVLLVLQGLDASGKDGVVRSVFEGINPQGCRVVSFKAPSSTELSHDYLWRVHASLPAHGEIGIFNRSHYEDVVAVRMLGLAPKKVWSRRTGHIREFERMLADEGTTIVKVFLNVSKDEQQKRLQERIDNADKRWKFRKDDLDVRTKFDDYIAAYEDAVTETSTDWAPVARRPG